MNVFLKMCKLVFIGIFALSVVIGAFALVAYQYFARDLPSVGTLKDIQLQTPLQVYSREGMLLGVFGEKRRKPLKYEELPEQMVEAFLAAEDDRFFQHPGVDYQGILRAVIKLALSGEKKQGGSTITMQLARNFFLSSERTYIRKIKEILLALRIENELSKQEILTLYLNKIYLGSRAYGVGAAAEVFYGKEVAELDLAQIAMIAGLPKAPSGNNPITNPRGALVRRNYVLRRMHELRMISNEAYQQAVEAPVSAALHEPVLPVSAHYVSEMVRQEVIRRFGEERAYEGGLKVYTTLMGERQNIAVQSLQNGLLDYDLRHGYRGPIEQLNAEQLATSATVMQKLTSMPVYGGLVPAVVLSVSDEVAVVQTEQQKLELRLPAVKWARKYISADRMGGAPTKVADVLTVGDVIRVRQQADETWQLSQLPEVSGALVSLNPKDGAIEALVGGFDFYQSKFNRAVQARRQPGSAFKPFIYSAALEQGYTAATLVNDAPVVFENQSDDNAWRPQNYSGQFFGPTRLRQALIKSRNMVSIRVLRDIGRRSALDHIRKFGFEVDRFPRDLTLALGSAEVSPLELASAYTLFANQGFVVEPYLISRIEGPDGEPVYVANPAQACDQDCQQLAEELRLHEEEFAELGLDFGNEKQPINILTRAVDEENIYVMDSMMKDVIQYGTGTKAKVLGRKDLAGKTGTTNDQKDAWFSGYQPTLVTTVWVGFDAHKPLGRREVGGAAALPIWIDYMRVALKGVPEANTPLPPGMVVLKINPDTGLLVDQASNYGIAEVFPVDRVPKIGQAGYQDYGNPTAVQNPGISSQQTVPEQLF